MQTKKYMGHHEITEKSGGLKLNFVHILPNYRFSVILKLLNQHEITIIRLMKLKCEKYRPPFPKIYASFEALFFHPSRGTGWP